MMDDYPWQQQQWRQLLSQYRQERLPHALLLSGPAGLGKLIFARRFAGILLCKAATACGQCAGCRLILANNHPDLLNIVPEETGKNIKVDQIREMIFTLNQTGQRAGYQVAIIAPAEALNKAAANALLKTLEEPLGKVVLLLVSHQPGALPATITSRCQAIKFTATAEWETSGVPADENAGMAAETWLRAKLQTLNIQADANLLLKISEYAPLRALDLAQNNYLTLRDQLLAHLSAIGQRKTPLLAPVTDYLKQDLHLWVDAFIAVTFDTIRLHLGVAPTALVNQDRLPQLQLLQQHYSLSALWPLLDKLNEARRLLLNNQIHLNTQLLLESLFIHWERGYAIR